MDIGKNDNGANKNRSEKRGFVLPSTSSKPSMPSVKPPKKKEYKFEK